MSNPDESSLGFFLKCNCLCCSSDDPDATNEENQPLLSNNKPVRSGSALGRMVKCCSPVTTGSCGLLCLLIAIVLAFSINPLVNYYINSDIKISPSSSLYPKWVNPPVTPYLQIYFFNVTNSEAFMKNQTKPILKEVGPYVYREHWKRVNVSFHENMTVSYSMLKEFYFEPSLSAGSEDDVIHTINIPVTLAVEKTKSLPKLMQLLINSLLVTINETVFQDKTVKELMWGYEDPLIEVAKKYLPKNLQFPFPKFGLFYGRNNSGEGVNSVFTGADDIEKVGQFDSFDYNHRLPYWNTAECNMLNGSDGTAYPPFVKKTSRLHMFNKNLCRSLPLTFNNSYDIEGLETLRFTPPKDVFASVSDNPENACYCVDGPPCIGGGVFNLSSCNFNTTVLISWPHFYQADLKYLDAVEGLKPDPQKHSFYVDVNPRLGVPMSSQARLQINFLTSNSTNIKMMANMTTMVFPVLWFEDGVKELNPDTLRLINMATTIPKIVSVAFPVFVFCLSLVLILLSAVCIWHRRKSQSLTLKEQPALEGHVNPVVSPEKPD